MSGEGRPRPPPRMPRSVPRSGSCSAVKGRTRSKGRASRLTVLRNSAETPAAWEAAGLVGRDARSDPPNAARTLPVLHLVPEFTGLVLEWWSAHRNELAENWQLIAEGKEPKKIPPLE